MVVMSVYLCLLAEMHNSHKYQYTHENKYHAHE